MVITAPGRSRRGGPPRCRPGRAEPIPRIPARPARTGAAAAGGSATPASTARPRGPRTGTSGSPDDHPRPAGLPGRKAGCCLVGDRPGALAGRPLAVEPDADLVPLILRARIPDEPVQRLVAAAFRATAAALHRA